MSKAMLRSFECLLTYRTGPYSFGRIFHASLLSGEQGGNRIDPGSCQIEHSL